jgi:hypothetical protein
MTNPAAGKFALNASAQVRNVRRAWCAKRFGTLRELVRLTSEPARGYGARDAWGTAEGAGTVSLRATTRIYLPRS